MDWKKVAIDDLRGYEAKKLSLVNMPERMEALVERSRAVRSSTGDSTPVSGGTSTAEDRLISNIVERDKLMYNISAIKREVGAIERALSCLDKPEHLVLERFYIHRPKNHIDVICEELNYEERNVYRLKDEALKNFTRAMYGVIEL